MQSHAIDDRIHGDGCLRVADNDLDAAGVARSPLGGRSADFEAS